MEPAISTMDLQVGFGHFCSHLSLYPDTLRTCDQGGRALAFTTTPILKQIEYGLEKEYSRLYSKVVFYLLQDGCIYTHQTLMNSLADFHTLARSSSFASV